MLTVTIKNFRSIGCDTYSFDNGVNLLQGVSGAGKTTIIEAIKWCLYEGPDYRPFGHNNLVTEVMTTFVAYDLVILRKSSPKKSIQVNTIEGAPLDPSIIDRLFCSKKLFEVTSHISQKGANMFLSGASEITIDELIYQDTNTPKTTMKRLVERVREMEANKPDINFLKNKIETVTREVSAIVDMSRLTTDQIENFSKLRSDLAEKEAEYKTYQKAKLSYEHTEEELSNFERKGLRPEYVKLCESIRLAKNFIIDFEFDGYRTIDKVKLPVGNIAHAVHIDDLVREEMTSRMKIVDECNSATILCSVDNYDWSWFYMEEHIARQSIAREEVLEIQTKVACPSTEIMDLLAKETEARNKIIELSRAMTTLYGSAIIYEEQSARQAVCTKWFETYPVATKNFSDFFRQENDARRAISRECASSFAATWLLSTNSMIFQEEYLARQAVCNEWFKTYPVQTTKYSLDGFLEEEQATRRWIVKDYENEFYRITTADPTNLIFEEESERLRILEECTKPFRNPLEESECISRNAIIDQYNFESEEFSSRWNLCRESTADFAALIRRPYEQTSRYSSAVEDMKKSMKVDNVRDMIALAPITCEVCKTAITPAGKLDPGHALHNQILGFFRKNEIDYDKMDMQRKFLARAIPTCNLTLPKKNSMKIGHVIRLPNFAYAPIALPHIRVTPAPVRRIGLFPRITLNQVWTPITNIILPRVSPKPYEFVLDDQSPISFPVANITTINLNYLSLSPVRKEVYVAPQIRVRTATFYQWSFRPLPYSRSVGFVPLIAKFSIILSKLDEHYHALRNYSATDIRSMMVNTKHSNISKEAYWEARESAYKETGSSNRQEFVKTMTDLRKVNATDQDLGMYGYLLKKRGPAPTIPDFNAELYESIRRFDIDKYTHYRSVIASLEERLAASEEKIKEINRSVELHRSLFNKLEEVDRTYKACGLDFITAKVNMILSSALTAPATFSISGIDKKLSWELEYNGYVRTKLSQLSGGEQDKLSFAMTIAVNLYLNSGFLAFDESFNAMDETSRTACLGIFSEFSFGDCVIIFISHNDLGLNGKRVTVINE